MTTLPIETVHVGLPGREYDILIGQNVLALAGDKIADLTGRKRVAIITDENVAAAHLAGLHSPSPHCRGLRLQSPRP